MWYIIGIGGELMDEEKVVETVPVEEETAPVETVEETTPFEETAPVETDSNEDVLTLLREVLTEIKALSTLTTDTSVQVEDVDDGSNDNNADELEKQLEDFDF